MLCTHGVILDYFCMCPVEFLDVVGCVLGAEMPNLLAMFSRDLKQFVVYKTTCGLPAVCLSVHDIPSA